MAVKSYRELIVWERSLELACEVYRLTGRFLQKSGSVSPFKCAAPLPRSFRTSPKAMLGTVGAISDDRCPSPWGVSPSWRPRLS